MKNLLIWDRVTVYVHKIVKYEDREEGIKVQYTGVEAFAVIEGEGAKDIEKNLNEQDYDPYREYLVIYFKDGTEATFRNSYVDMFNH